MTLSKLTSRVWPLPARLFAVLWILGSITAWGLEVPALTGRVVDLAGVLSSAQKESLTGALKAHEDATTNQVAVLILPSLEGDPVESFSHRVATTWKLGRIGADNGVLLLVAIKERKVRIEVGYGLEGSLTDLRSAHIIRDEIVPRFRARDMAGGIEAGVQAILWTIGQAEAGHDQPPPKASSGDRTAGIEFVVIGIVVGFLAGMILSQGKHRVRALFGSLLSIIVAQSAGIPLALLSGGVTAVLLWLILQGNRRTGGQWISHDWTSYSSRDGGWSGGSLGGGFSGGGGDFGGGGASGDW
ncbi:hypothetical protein W02_23030 [Nitrospira sp. KM1]|uniref:TPM domain-containing protein n=1 Tax=Nitrospira sp. KM1 TaxID=1936990 RepID=UPI0013A7AB84|nr:TPM domain-containing protein [Nitrospira sp. KM1]BCA55163.1 hypothetical protein W02_23030 [Nitrospira sp. KM1]